MVLVAGDHTALCCRQVTSAELFPLLLPLLATFSFNGGPVSVPAKDSLAMCSLLCVIHWYTTHSYEYHIARTSGNITVTARRLQIG